MIPEVLRAYPQWVGWRYEARDGKRTKVPYDAKTGERASSTDPSTWSTYEQARAVKNHYDGLGFVFTLEAGIERLHGHQAGARPEVGQRGELVSGPRAEHTAPAGKAF